MAWQTRAGLALMLMLTLVPMMVAACGDDEPEMTIEERLEALEGRSLTPREVDELLETAEAVCLLDDTVLEAVWARLDLVGFDFQDFIFAHQCPQRATFYALSTGRVVTDEAADDTDGVILPTSTVPPPTTTTLPPPVDTSLPN